MGIDRRSDSTSLMLQERDAGRQAGVPRNHRLLNVPQALSECLERAMDVLSMAQLIQISSFTSDIINEIKSNEKQTRHLSGTHAWLFLFILLIISMEINS